jgi:two-component system cell cycle sensor histidine kinase/response regulator CckA
VSEDDIVRNIVEGQDEGVLVATRDGLYLFNNAQFDEIVGTAPDGRSHTLETAFASEPTATAAIYRLTRSASRGEFLQEEFEVNGGGSTPRVMRASCRPFSVKGQPFELGPLVLWKISDVTAERSKQAAYVRFLQSNVAMFDKVPVGLLAVSPDGTITYCNQLMALWIGFSGARLRDGKGKVGDILDADNVQMLRASARSLERARAGIEADVIASDGRRIAMRLLGQETDDGTLLVAAYNRETDCSGAADYGDADVRLSRFLHSAPFGIATVNSEGRIVTANAALTRMLVEGSAGAGDQAIDVICGSADKETRAAFEASLKQAVAGSAQVTPVEITLGAEGQFSRRVLMTPLAGGGTTGESAILYVIDSTEQKALEAKFAQSSKMEAVGKLAGGIAHDFNNVLTAIIGFSDLLLQTQRPSDPSYKDIMNIRSSANRAAGLVAKLLAFSRRQTLQTAPLQLGEVISDLGTLLNRSIGEKIELKLPPARDLWYVKADKTQFEQVMINLAVNARDAMPDGGVLTIRTRNVSERESLKIGTGNVVPGEYVLVEVEDTGTGMSREVLSKIFEPFFTTKGVGKGTGLGLATVYGFVKQSGGYIYADSELGRGTKFDIYLPRHIPESEDEVQVQKADKPAPSVDLTGTGRVLLVEDEDVVRNFAVRALKRQGYEVFEATSGIEALELMAKIGDKVDVVVSDVVMPEMDGPTLLKKLREKNPSIKIIFVSGYPHEAFETSLDKDQQFAFLPKPFSLPQLAAKVKEQLGR